MHPDYKFENTVANGEFMIATAVIGASNALRERAWDPAVMWGWADPLVEKATQAVYQKVFTVFGVITLVVVGLYLLWRARQSDMSQRDDHRRLGAARHGRGHRASPPGRPGRPTRRQHPDHLARRRPRRGWAPRPRTSPPISVAISTRPHCTDNRAPALRASDTAVEGMLYRNWLRGVLGSADSETAKKYGPVLYDAKSFTWDEIAGHPRRPEAAAGQSSTRRPTSGTEVAEQIKAEDPEAYEYLQGVRGHGADRRRIHRDPLRGLLRHVRPHRVDPGPARLPDLPLGGDRRTDPRHPRPAAPGQRRAAAAGNVVIAAHLQHHHLRHRRRDLPVRRRPDHEHAVAARLAPGGADLLTGVVGWLLLRPYRRITQLGGKRAGEGSGGWGRALLRDLRASANPRSGDAGAAPADQRRTDTLRTALRPESRTEDVVVIGTPGASRPGTVGTAVPEHAQTSRRPEDAQPQPDAPQTSAPGAETPVPATPRRRAVEWEEPDIPAEATAYSVYRPDSDRSRTPVTGARRPESASIPG